ncbi:MAG: hypothetical protein HY763_16485 [Planctomycetes bacterium]|nr:hypothetical protein [Planctomycetota bacterium]
MPRKVNVVCNPDFARGRRTPARWTWHGGADATWRRQDAADAAPRRNAPGHASCRARRGAAAATATPPPEGEASAVSAGITIEVSARPASASWSQTVACKPGEYYRVEATISCALEAEDERHGFVLRLEPAVRYAARGGQTLRTPAIHRSTAPIAVRAYYHAPGNVAAVRLCVGIESARGWVTIHHVRFIRILEPDEESHLLAVPPPRWSLPAPRTVQGVCVCSERAAGRPITAILKGFLGERGVQTLAPPELRGRDVRTDALLLPDEAPPPGVRTLAALMSLAERHLVVISLPAFARLSRGTLRVRTIVQEDDPIHARVLYAGCATHGFALHDVFAYAWAGEPVGSFVQRQLRKSAQLKAFCARHALQPVLESMCDKESTSEHPICLQRLTPGGGLLVLDVEPAEARNSTMGEPNLAVHLLLSILGRTQAGLGQYVVPQRSEAAFRDIIRETAARFPAMVVHDADVPAAEVAEQLVTVGREDQSFGLPLSPKPVILVRSGLSSGDLVGVYAAHLWFKQLLRVAPFACPYAEALAARFRLAWMPCVATYEWHEGWQRRAGHAPHAMSLEADAGGIAAVIDLVSAAVAEPRVVLPEADGHYAPYARWLPRLSLAFSPYQGFTLTAPEAPSGCDRDEVSWRRPLHNLRVLGNPPAFEGDPFYDEVRRAGGQLVRVEVPGAEADFCAHSIARTALAANLLEHVIGMQYGLIAVNRGLAPVQLDGFPPVAPGQALLVERGSPALDAAALQAV